MVTDKKVIEIIRGLARSNFWQTLYCQSKEISGLKLFFNTEDFTSFQILFLDFLAFYNSIYLDIAMGEVPEFVLDNFIYEDAYYSYRNKVRSEKFKQNKEKSAPSKPGKKDEQIVVGKKEWVLKKPKK